ncbi:MAG: hypothetical protein ABI653_02295 [Bacteroidota bacterium]
MANKFLLYFFIGFIIIGVASFFLPIAIFSLGKYGLVIAVTVFIIIVLAFVYLMTKVAAKGLKPPNLPNGIPALATITNFQQSGINLQMGTYQYYEMLIDVNVHGNDGSNWPARIKQMISIAQLNMFPIGATITVKYDPDKKSKVVLSNEIPNGSHVFNSPGFNGINKARPTR